jgi:hypothetical protein
LRFFLYHVLSLVAESPRCSRLALALEFQ